MDKEITNHLRTVVVGFRLTESEAAHIQAAGEAMRTPRSRNDFCRAAALYTAKQKVPEPVRQIRHKARQKPTADIEALGRIIAALGKIGSNINQIAHNANRSGSTPALAILSKAAADISEIKMSVTTAIER
ncbi:MAG: plasmid mobilization relaxosome protein MobC [Rhodospirillaceae bacterium]